MKSLAESIQDSIEKGGPIFPPDIVPPGKPLDLNRLARLSQFRGMRTCRTCSSEFDAHGMQTICDTCAMVPVEPVKRIPEIHPSWPSKHLRRIPTMHGRSLALAEKLAPRITSPRFFVMAGGRGVGKTQVAAYLADWRAKHGYSSGIYTRARDMVAAIVGFDREEKLQKYQRASFLIIDECHRIQPSDIPIMESVVDDRYANERTTGMIGNWQTTEGIHRGENIDDEQLSGIGSSLFNRLQEHQKEATGGVVWCRWPSYRDTESTPEDGL